MTAFSVAATGDSIITRPLSAATRALGQRVLAPCDVRFTNLEILCPRKPRIPSAVLHGIALTAPESILDHLSELGFNLFSVANNHAADYTHQGLVDTMQALDARRMTYAGGGMTLTAARRSSSLNVKGGRVALISATSSNSRLALAADPGPGDIGRPGVNPLRFATRYVLTPERYRELCAALQPLGFGTTNAATFAGISLIYPDRGLYQPTRDPNSVYVEGVQFSQGNADHIETKCNVEDLQALCDEIRTAAQSAQLVLASLHCHEGLLGGWNTSEPADFIRDATHALIDAGAHAVLGHGSHCLRGIEIYKGCPIVYSLGNFMFELDSLESLPNEVLAQQGLPSNSSPRAFMDHLSPVGRDGKPGGMLGHSALWQSVIAHATFEGGRCKQMMFEPIALRSARADDLGELGSPRAPTEEQAAKTLDDLVQLSRKFGSHIEVERAGGQLRGLLRIN